METPIEFLKTKNIEVTIGDKGILLKHGDSNEFHAEIINIPSPEKALRIAYERKMFDSENEKIRIYPQTLDRIGLSIDQCLVELTQLGVLVFSIEYDSYGSIFFLKTAPFDVALPEYMEKY